MAHAPAERAAKIRVGLILDWENWLGGISYLRNLIAATQSLPQQRIDFVGFCGKQAKNPDFPGITLIRTSILDPRSALGLLRRLVRRLTQKDLLLQGLLLAHGIEVVSHANVHWVRSRMVIIAWIADFQHLHLTDLFPPEERVRRDQTFSALCAACDTLVLSSECALADLSAFSPASIEKAEVLRFVAGADSSRLLPDLQGLSATYKFKPPYFLLPNQYWKHKNHALVIRALRILKERDVQATVLSTGFTGDFRSPEFFQSVLKLARECDVLDRFLVLGAIPFDPLLGLMRDAVAVLNPSLFEGWSTSVEEAKSMGKLVLLSDIPVHREQVPPQSIFRAVFFDPASPEALADAMELAQREFDPQADLRSQQAARADFARRQQEFGARYVSIVETSLRRHSAATSV